MCENDQNGDYRTLPYLRICYYCVCITRMSCEPDLYNIN